MVPTVQQESEKHQDLNDKSGVELVNKKLSPENVNSDENNPVSNKALGNGIEVQGAEDKLNDDNSDMTGKSKDNAAEKNEKSEIEKLPDISSSSDNATDKKEEPEIQSETSDIQDKDESLNSQVTKKSPSRKHNQLTPKKSPEEPEQTRSGRVRKQISRLSNEMDKVFKEKESIVKSTVIPVGRGCALGDIEVISEAITKTKTDNLKLLHRLIYNRVGKPHDIRSNLKKFNGFDFTENDDVFTKKLTSLTSHKMGDLKECLRVLGLEVSGNRDELAKRLMAFLLEPSRDAPKRKHPKSSHKKTGRKSKKGEDAEVSDAKMDNEDADKPKKKSKKRKLSEPKGSSAKKPRKSSDAVDMDDIFASALGKSLSSDDDDDEASDSEKADSEDESSNSKKHPTDSDLKHAVEDCLKDADLESVTMKTVCQQVFDKYPDFDLSHKRELIKKTVKQVLSRT